MYIKSLKKGNLGWLWENFLDNYEGSMKSIYRKQRKGRIFKNFNWENDRITLSKLYTYCNLKYRNKLL